MRATLTASSLRHTLSTPPQALLDLKHLLIEARQRVPPVLQALDDIDDNINNVNGVRGCAFCGGLGQCHVLFLHMPAQ